MFGQKRPMFNPVYPGLTNGAQTISGPKTFTDTLTINKTSAASTAEEIARFKVSDDANAYLGIFNASSGDATFAPDIRFVNNNGNVGGLITARVGDSGSNPVLRFDAFGTDGTSALTTRSVLFRFRNGSNTILDGVPLNSGANLCLSWGAQAGAAPAVTGATGSTRSIGTRLILSKNDSATEGDYSLGYSSGKMWAQLANTSANFEVYGAATRAAYIRGDGLTDTIGTIRATGATTPASGSGVEMLYSGGTGFVGAFNRSGSVRLPISVQGTTVALNTTGGDMIVAQTSSLILGAPLGLKSYTVATLPAATSAGQIIYVSDAAGTPCAAISNGTNWKRCDDMAVTVS